MIIPRDFALYVGPQNSAAVTGQPWRWLRDTLRARGVEPIRVGGKSMFRAADVVAVFERAAAEKQPSRPAAEHVVLDERAQRAAQLRQLGLVERQGAS